MAYIGNQVIPVPFLVNIFSGNATATNFGPLSRAPAGPASIIVFISGVYKVPGVDYTVDANYIYFATPPASAVNNIVVHHLGNGFMATQVPADGTVTGGKLTGNSIRGNNIVAGTITGNLIADTAIASNNIVVRAITGNLLGTGSISANNFAGGAITSNVLASNLSISVSRVSETININTAVVGSNSASGTNVNLDIVNTAVYYFSSNTSGNVTFNLRGNNINTFDSSVQVGNTVSVIVTLRHNTAAYRSGVNVMIDGGLIKTTLATPDTGNLIMYSGNTLPAHSPITAIESNIIGLNIIKKAANSYIVYMSNSIFGLT
jgi:hypothetical protein